MRIRYHINGLKDENLLMLVHVQWSYV